MRVGSGGGSKNILEDIGAGAFRKRTKSMPDTCTGCLYREYVQGACGAGAGRLCREYRSDVYAPARTGDVRDTLFFRWKFTAIYFASAAPS